MILKLLLLCSLLILSSSQEDNDAGNETAECDSVSQPTSLLVDSKTLRKSGNRAISSALPRIPTEYCTFRPYSCRLLRYPECCRVPQCKRTSARQRYCWRIYLAEQVQEVQQGVLEITTDLNEDILNIAYCVKNGCRVTGKNAFCCFHPTCYARRKNRCKWLTYARKGNEQTVSSTLQHNEDEMDVSVMPLRNDDVRVTLCKRGSSQTLNAGQLSSGQAAAIKNADCAFIIHDEDSTVPSCSTLAALCGQRALATLASWDLRWCPGRIKRRHFLLKEKEETYGICCYHPKYKNKATQCEWTKV